LRYIFHQLCDFSNIRELSFAAAVVLTTGVMREVLAKFWLHVPIARGNGTISKV